MVLDIVNVCNNLMIASKSLSCVIAIAMCVATDRSVHSTRTYDISSLVTLELVAARMDSLAILPIQSSTRILHPIDVSCCIRLAWSG